MGSLFRVLAKLVGIFWTAYALAAILSTGLALLAPGRGSEYLSNEVAFRLVTCVALLIQLGLAISLLLATDNWANLLGVPRDNERLIFSGEDVLTLGIKLIGVYFLVQSLPDVAFECLAIVHPAAEPVSRVSDVLPLIRPAATVLLGCLCAFGTASLTRLLARSRNDEPEEASP